MIGKSGLCNSNATKWIKCGSTTTLSTVNRTQGCAHKWYPVAAVTLNLKQRIHTIGVHSIRMVRCGVRPAE